MQDYEYYNHKEYFLEIIFHQFGFYNCTVLVEDKPQIFSHYIKCLHFLFFEL